VDVLNSHDSSSPVLSEVVVVVVLGEEVLLEGLEVLMVFLSHVGQSNGGGCLLVNQLSESGLVLDNAERNVLLSAESGQEHNKFNGIDITGNDNKLGFSAFNELSDVVESVLESNGLSILLGILSVSLLGSFSLKSVRFFLSGFRRVLGEELKDWVS
jgi:hypothetical protein